jgi:oligopeptide/dipeptide ABC transporter ATP-binding protein
VPTLEVRGLRVAFDSTEILRGVDLRVEAGKTLGVVGESGCGKSMTGLAIMGLLPPGGRITSGSIEFLGENIASAKESRLRKLRGGDIAMVFQDPFTSLNPSMRVADQIVEAVLLHRSVGRREAHDIALQQLHDVRVPSPESTARKYPFQLSGGQRQRVMIAMAFACRPKLLIADEPTTALDVTLQAQILALLDELKRKYDTAVILISHDIGVIGSVSDDIVVFYAGKVIEEGDVRQVLRTPAHPYTAGLLASLPGERKTLYSIPGQPPNFALLEGACSFRERCPKAHDRCVVEPGLLQLGGGHGGACWLVDSPVGELRL